MKYIVNSKKKNIKKILIDLNFKEIQKIGNLDLFKYIKRTKDFFRILPQKLDNYKKVLDIGIGTGWFSALMYNLYNYEIKGIGLENNMIFDTVYKKFNIDFTIYDITKGNFPFNDEKFDIILFMEVLEHLICPHPPYVIFDEINRILKDDGILIFSTPNFADIRKRISALLGKNPTYWNKNHPKTHMQHIREYTVKELKQILELCNFKIIKCIFTTQQPALKGIRRKILDFPYQILEKIYPKFRNTIIIRAKKRISTT